MNIGLKMFLAINGCFIVGVLVMGLGAFLIHQVGPLAGVLITTGLALIIGALVVYFDDKRLEEKNNAKHKS